MSKEIVLGPDTDTTHGRTTRKLSTQRVSEFCLLTLPCSPQLNDQPLAFLYPFNITSTAIADDGTRVEHVMQSIRMWVSTACGMMHGSLYFRTTLDSRRSLWLLTGRERYRRYLIMTHVKGRTRLEFDLEAQANTIV